MVNFILKIRMVKERKIFIENRKRISSIVTLSILIAIEIIVAFTPLGSLPAIGPIVMTLAHIPVIIAVIVLGFKGGLIMGLVYGFLSFLVWTFMPPSPIAFLFTPFYSLGDISGNFWSLVICFVPRILIGVLSYFFIKLIYIFSKKKSISTFFGPFFGNLISSLVLLVFTYVFFREPYATVLGVEYGAVMGVILMTFLLNAIPESILGGLVAYGIGKFIKNNKI